MIVLNSRRFEDIHDAIADNLYNDGQTVTATYWQGQRICDKHEMMPIELQNVIFEASMPQDLIGMRSLVQPNLPWADDHFNERVGGVPLNPPPSAESWPFAQAGHADHTNSRGEFSHTYPERFWPKHAGHWPGGCNAGNRCEGDEPLFCDLGTNAGIRFEYGDLEDVVELMRMDRHTRQAYLPVWFAEDTGATGGQRVPCSLGYHFMIRENKLHVTYLIRAVDFMRHFRDDVYMAMRLAHWVRDLMPKYQLTMGNLTMHTMSLHCFDGDLPALGRMVEGIAKGRSGRLMGAMR